MVFDDSASRHRFQAVAAHGLISNETEQTRIGVSANSAGKVGLRPFFRVLQMRVSDLEVRGFDFDLRILKISDDHR